jgi:hypothetical protein
MTTKNRTRDRLDIGNTVYAYSDQGVVDYRDINLLPGASFSSDAMSRAAWGRRELAFQYAGDNSTGQLPTTGTDPMSAATPSAVQASQELEKYKDELSSWTVTVPSVMEFDNLATPFGTTTMQLNRVFTDYNVGDWIGILSENAPGVRPLPQKLQVTAISIAVDNTGTSVLQLTLESNIQLLRNLQTTTR